MLRKYNTFLISILFLISFSIIFLLINRFSNDKDRLGFSIRAEIYDILFLQDKIALTTNDGIFLYNLLTGKKECHNKKTDGLAALVFNDKLLSKSNGNRSLCFLDIKTGKIIKEVEIGEFIHIIQIKDESNIFFVQGSGNNYLLRCYDDATGDIVNLSTIDFSPRNMECFDGNIFLTTNNPRLFYGWLYVINGTSYNTTAIYPFRLSYKDFIYRQEFLFLLNDEEKLIKADANGNILEYYPLPFDFSSSRFIQDKEMVLICGDRGKSLYAFDVKTEIFFEIEKNANGISHVFTMSNDNDVLYADQNSVYSYNLKNMEKQNLYDLNGMELFNMFSNGEWLVLITADDVHSAHANNWPFTVEIINLRTNK